MRQLISEITTASNEQARGVAQINTAVLEMGEITELNAANAEESAAAAEELSSHSASLRSVVSELEAMVSDTGQARRAAHRASEAPVVTSRSSAGPARLTPKDLDSVQGLVAAGPRSAGQKAGPQEIKLLNDRDLAGF